jgi:hypothetical protein
VPPPVFFYNYNEESNTNSLQGQILTSIKSTKVVTLLAKKCYQNVGACGTPKKANLANLASIAFFEVPRKG